MKRALRASFVNGEISRKTPTIKLPAELPAELPAKLPAKLPAELPTGATPKVADKGKALLKVVKENFK